MRYRVTTWDTEKQAWTPQAGVRAERPSWASLLRALRKLRTMGYSAHRGDLSTLVERLDCVGATPGFAEHDD